MASESPTGVGSDAAAPLALSHGTRRTTKSGRARRLGDASGGRRRTPCWRGQPGDGRVRCLSQRADPPGQRARVHHSPLRGRGAEAPRGAGATPPLLGRLRPVPQGSGRRAAPVGRPHRPTTHRGARPMGVPRQLVRALQGTAAGCAARARRGDGGDLPDRDVHLGRLPRPGPRGGVATRGDRGGARQTPHQKGERRRGRLRTGGRRPGGVGRQRGRRSSRDRIRRGDRPLPLPPLLPRVRPGHRHHHGLRRRHHDAVLHLRLLRPGGHDRPVMRQRRQARLEGRLADALGL